MGLVKGPSIAVSLLLLISLLLSGVVRGQTLQADPNRIFDGLLPTPRLAPPLQAGAKRVYQGFMYVQPNQMRFEVLLDSASAQKAVGMEVTNSLDGTQRKALKAALDAKAPRWCEIKGDQPLLGSFMGTLFMRGIPDERESAPLSEAALEGIVVGLSWSFPFSPNSTGLDLMWKGYFQDQKELPIQIFYGGHTESVVTTEEVAVFEWRPDGPFPTAIALLPVPSLHTPPPWRLPLASILCFSGGLFVFLWCTLRKHRLPGGSLAFFSAWFVGALLTWPLLVVKIPGSLEKAMPTQIEQAERIVTPLLRNVYRTYDQGTDAKILALLPRNLVGAIVLSVHDEISQDLLARSEPTAPRLRLGELGVKVHQMSLNNSGNGFIIKCSYQGKAEGLYWGDPVEKEFQHKAAVHVSVYDGEWRIAKIEKIL